ncbi:solute carrier family 35, member E1 [Entomortierella parvispora]|uniref:Solute carrier family 35, member E1 n=1 Tax=Entomortierella parvispora TaxID=205924 RepID=A0A9P3H635_9FUNG|nr:solute carrier family 35, member E1 [Entomortierella parvispora]
MAAATTASALSPGQQQQGHYLKSASSTTGISSGPTSFHPKSQSAPNQLPVHPSQYRQHQFQPHQPTDALLHQQSFAFASSDGSSSGVGADPDQPLSVRIQQLPTPRTSMSSGASSPPETLSPSAHSLSPTQARHPQQLHPTNTSSSHHYASHSSSTPPSVRPDFQSTLASNFTSPIHSNNGSGIQGGVNSNAPYTRSPLAYQTQAYLSSPPAHGPKLAPSLFEPSSSTSPLAGSSIYNMNGSVGASTTATAASTSSTTMGGRVLFQAQQNEYEQQHQQQLLWQDEKDMQKKSARSNTNSFLPPALNKVVQSAMEAVNVPTSPNSSHSLPSSRMSTIPEASGPSGPTVSAFAPRSSVRSRLGPSSILGLIAKVYKATQLPLICLSWYFSSAVTNNLGKQILNQFSYPVTLTFVQFWFMAVFCFMAGAVFKMTTLRSPSRAIVQLTAPLVGFQVIGHVFSSVAISRVPLSVVHTVKALTPLFTVLFYRVVLGTTYSRAVYLSLVPLTAGVMLACRMSLEFNNLVGLFCALLSTLVFVTQNVFTKKILSSSKTKQQQHQELHGMGGLGNRESASGSGLDPVDEVGSQMPKLDKINILFYSSTMAAVCMIPMWFYAEGGHLMFGEDPLGDGMRAGAGAAGHTVERSGWGHISWLLFLNGVSHFFQNIFAFSVLALTSPVTYSIASLIKRIVVIVASIVYFHQTLGATQWTGVCLTFWGLWMYNSAKNAAKVNPSSGILATTKVGRRMSRGFGRGLLDSDAQLEHQRK